MMQLTKHRKVNEKSSADGFPRHARHTAHGFMDRPMNSQREGAARFTSAYLTQIQALLARIHDEECEVITQAAERIAEQVAADKLVHVYGPGGHSNLAAQEVFFRAGGLAYISSICW